MLKNLFYSALSQRHKLEHFRILVNFKQQVYRKNNYSKPLQNLLLTSKLTCWIASVDRAAKHIKWKVEN